MGIEDLQRLAGGIAIGLLGYQVFRYYDRRRGRTQIPLVKNKRGVYVDELDIKERRFTLWWIAGMLIVAVLAMVLLMAPWR